VSAVLVAVAGDEERGKVNFSSQTHPFISSTINAQQKVPRKSFFYTASALSNDKWNKHNRESIWCVFTAFLVVHIAHDDDDDTQQHLSAYQRLLMFPLI
jgi:hypothetical protein